MKNIVNSLAITFTTLGLILFTQIPQSLASNDENALCPSRSMVTEITMKTADFFAAICSAGYYDDTEYACYNITQYYYVGQSRITGESVTLPATEEYLSKSNILIYKASKDNYTYQIAMGGEDIRQGWASLSVFDNGNRIYHQKMNDYGYYQLPCL